MFLTVTVLVPALTVKSTTLELMLDSLRGFDIVDCYLREYNREALMYRAGVGQMQASNTALYVIDIVAKSAELRIVEGGKERNDL